jgi:hypothetical protein
VEKIEHHEIKIDAFNFGSSISTVVIYTKPNTMESGNSALAGTAESFFPMFRAAS